MRPKGSARKLETRRRRAAKMLSQGNGIREVARRVKASPSSVKRWKDAVKKGGSAALNPKPHTGRPARLTPKQHQQLLRALGKGPKAFKLRTHQWTNGHVRTIIRRIFGVRYHRDHVGRILRDLGWKDSRSRRKSLRKTKAQKSTALKAKAKTPKARRARRKR